MKTIISKLEANNFSGIVIKKGKNIITEKQYSALAQNKDFFEKMQKGYFEFIELPLETNKKKEDLTKGNLMTYEEMKTFVKENKIEVQNNKKATLENAIKDFLETNKKKEVQ